MEDVHGCIDALNSLVQKATIGYVPTYVVFHVGNSTHNGVSAGIFFLGVGAAEFEQRRRKLI